ncbi:hypothetical protein BEP19_15160 [Ammoniphilus oxalaticus]|uniref:Uncharacterized protein n=1 Tax=Ammoniphilus oxalaticus TaxID=66863 RepID=A0A419SD15_9BACL|nr:hypothetical protein [Ammoniphilus oxalaticus]RKD21019.1 hypothetical protein BEP19_15160 [Ammoniphilus oxalaticus]
MAKRKIPSRLDQLGKPTEMSPLSDVTKRSEFAPPILEVTTPLEVEEPSLEIRSPSSVTSIY